MYFGKQCRRTGNFFRVSAFIRFLTREGPGKTTTYCSESTHIIYWASAWDFQQCGLCNQQRLRSACAYAQSDQKLCSSLEYSMTVKILTEHLLEVLSLTGGCTGLSEPTLVKCHIVGNHMTRLFYDMGLVARNLACKQQMCRPACPSTQSQSGPSLDSIIFKCWFYFSLVIEFFLTCYMNISIF